MIFGIALSTIYLTIVIIIGLCTILYLFFADMADGAAEGIPFFDPAVMLAFITITAAAGYILEIFSSLSHLVIFLISIVISLISTALI